MGESGAGDLTISGPWSLFAFAKPIDSLLFISFFLSDVCALFGVNGDAGASFSKSFCCSRLKSAAILSKSFSVNWTGLWYFGESSGINEAGDSVGIGRPAGFFGFFDSFSSKRLIFERTFAVASETLSTEAVWFMVISIPIVCSPRTVLSIRHVWFIVWLAVIFNVMSALIVWFSILIGSFSSSESSSSSPSGPKLNMDIICLAFFLPNSGLWGEGFERTSCFAGLEMVLVGVFNLGDCCRTILFFRTVSKRLRRFFLGSDIGVIGGSSSDNVTFGGPIGDGW